MVKIISEYQDEIAKKRLSDIKNKRVIGKSEKELDSYLIKRGIKDNALIQLKLSLEDLRHKRVKKFNLKSSK